MVFPARIEEFWAKTQSDSNSSILRLLPSSTMLRDHELPFLQFILLVVKKLLSSTLLHCKMKNPGVDGLLRQVNHFLTDISNQVELLKRNQQGIENWAFGFVFGVQLSLRQRALII